jgi:hypothetical protein
MLRDSAAMSKPPAEPVPIDSRALGTLSYIRASIDAAGSLAVPGMAGIVMGCIGIVAALLASVPELAEHQLIIWMIAAAAAFVLGGALMARQAALHGSRSERNGGTSLFGRAELLQGGGALSRGPFRKFLLCLCPALLAGSVLTYVLWQPQETATHIPGMWLLLYGCAVIAASTVTSTRNLKLIAFMGALFMALGIVTFMMPTTTHNLMLGAGFGVFHVIFGVLIGRANHGE